MKKHLFISLIIIFGLLVFGTVKANANLETPQCQGYEAVIKDNTSSSDQIILKWKHLPTTDSNPADGKDDNLWGFIIWYKTKMAYAWRPEYVPADTASYNADTKIWNWRLLPLMPNTSYEWQINAVHKTDPTKNSSLVHCAPDFKTPPAEILIGGIETVRMAEMPEYYTFSPPLKAQELKEIFNDALDYLFLIAIVAAPLIFIISAFLLMTVEPEKINQAKQLILWTIIALFIVFLARFIPTMVKTLIGG